MYQPTPAQAVLLESQLIKTEAVGYLSAQGDRLYGMLTSPAERANIAAEAGNEAVANIMLYEGVRQLVNSILPDRLAPLAGVIFTLNGDGTATPIELEPVDF